jgi:uncharacterized protein (DUF1501 family)
MNGCTGRRSLRRALSGDEALSRRAFLLGGTGLVASIAGLSMLSPLSIFEAAASEAAVAPDAPILVSVYLGGGNDGLNSLIPLTDSRYRDLRKRVAIDAERALPLSGSTDFGWHPSLSGIERLFDAGKVAVLPAVDFANPDQSHFNSYDYWARGVVGAQDDPSGWLGRAIDSIGTTDNPLQAVSLGETVDPQLSSLRVPVATLRRPKDFSVWVPGLDETIVAETYATLVDGARLPALTGVQTACRGTFRMINDLKPLTVADPAGTRPEKYPATDLGKDLRDLARVLDSGFGTRMATVNHNAEYDTHEEQPGHHAEILRDLGDSLSAFQADIEARGLGDRVMTVVWSEFGRRPEDNANNGTDHGAGGLMLVVGNRAAGGIATEFPGLRDLDDDKNLKVTTEFRSVWATLLESWMQIDAEAILPGIDQTRIPILRA